MKRFIGTVLLSMATLASAQDKMTTKTGKVIFEASVPAFEEVKATNATATFVLNPATGDVASLVLMKAFRFKIALMEEHFNENYIESERYPKAKFTGKIDGFDVKSLTSAAKDYTIKGKMEMRGKTKNVTAPAKIRKTDSGIEIITDFVINTDDFDIQIPAVVKSKVSKNVTVHGEFTVK